MDPAATLLRTSPLFDLESPYDRNRVLFCTDELLTTRPELLRCLKSLNIVLYTFFLRGGLIEEIEEGEGLLKAIKEFKPHLVILFAWGRLCEVVLPAQTTEKGLANCYARLGSALQTIAAVRGCPVVLLPAECVPLDGQQYLLYLKSKTYLSYTGQTEPANIQLNLANVYSLSVRREAAFVLNKYFERLHETVYARPDNKLHPLLGSPRAALRRLERLISAARGAPNPHTELWKTQTRKHFTQLGAEAAALVYPASAIPAIVRGTQPGMGYSEYPLRVQNLTLRQRQYAHQAQALVGLRLERLLNLLDRPLVRASIWCIAPKQQSHNGVQLGDFARSCLTTFVPLLFEEETCYLFFRGEQRLLENGSIHIIDTSYRFALSNGSERTDLIVLVLDWLRLPANLPRLSTVSDFALQAVEEAQEYTSELVEFLSDSERCVPIPQLATSGSGPSREGRS